MLPSTPADLPASPARGVTRRRLLRALAAAGAGTGTLLLGSCAAKDVAGASAGASAAVDNASRGPSDTFPVTIEHALGRTTVSAEPHRVATVGPVSADVVISLGIVPAALPHGGAGAEATGLYPWTSQALEALGVVWGTRDAPVLVGSLPSRGGGQTDGEMLGQDVVARLTELEPDLILGVAAGLTEDQYEALSAIAPTIARPKGTPPLGGSWEQTATLIGQALGRSAAAEALIRTTETEVTTAASSYPQLAGATYQALRLTVEQARGGQSGDAQEEATPSPAPQASPTSIEAAPSSPVGVYTQVDARSRFLELVGLRLAAGAQDAGADDMTATSVPAATRRLDSLTADLTWADLDRASTLALGLPDPDVPDAAADGGADAAASPSAQAQDSASITGPATEPATPSATGEAAADGVEPAGASEQVLQVLASDPQLSAVPDVAGQAAYVVVNQRVLAAVAESSPLSLPWLCEHHLPELAQRVERTRAQATASASASRAARH